MPKIHSLHFRNYENLQFSVLFSFWIEYSWVLDNNSGKKIKKQKQKTTFWLCEFKVNQMIPETLINNEKLSLNAALLLMERKQTTVGLDRSSLWLHL